MFAVSTDAFKSDLEKAGYKVTVDAVTKKHDTLKVEGKVLTIEKDGKRAKVEVLDYGTGAKLAEDWTAMNGKAPAPVKATSDFAGAIVTWNNDSVAIFDLRSPNDASVARAAQAIYLGPGGTGGAEPGRTATPGAPNTGSAGPASSTRDAMELDPQNVILGAIFIIALGGLVVSVRSAIRDR